MVMEGSGLKLKMLNRSASRNQRSRSLKVKHALWILVLLAICIWFLYQSHNKNGALEKRPAQVSVNDEYQLLRMGRKDLRRRADNVAAEVQKDGEDEAGGEDGDGRERETDEEGSVFDRDEEMDAGDKEKSEEAEHDQLLELIDEDDKDR
ncbi:hypothetical protein Salat_0591200 [Sesamum alatum]|uniref:Uncharacterized protein n=1 Tax=Sesamum alatum TaxID=300844 RepID=A0AAE2CU63_9LAMI|nr:hypothetical protein Salat_0591200 [Sesamum alatum]